MSATRVYKLAPKDVPTPKIVPNVATPRLVRATSQSQSYSHVARTVWTATVATQVDLIDLISQGVQVENAREE